MSALFQLLNTIDVKFIVVGTDLIGKHLLLNKAIDFTFLRAVLAPVIVMFTDEHCLYKCFLEKSVGSSAAHTVYG